MSCSRRNTIQISIPRGIPHAGSHRHMYTRIVPSIQLQTPRSSFWGTQFTVSVIKPVLSCQLSQLPTINKTVTLGVTGGVLGVWHLEQVYHKSHCPWPRVKNQVSRCVSSSYKLSLYSYLLKKEHSSFWSSSINNVILQFVTYFLE